MEDSRKKSMSFEEAQRFEEERGYGISWNDGDISIDGRHLTESIANAIKWADENPKPMTYEEKRELAEWLCRANHGYVTGSMALAEHGVKLERGVKDIDFVVETDDIETLIIPPFCKFVEFEREDGYLVFARTYYRGTKIEFIRTLLSIKHSDYVSKNYNSFRYSTLEEILHVKKRYIEEDTDLEGKHAKDIELIKEFITPENDYSL